MPRSPSPWWKRAVFYQVYPRSFADSNGDGVGDLAGITAHLDHLAGTPESLGVDAIWLSPFYRSPMADFGYDVADYRDVDPAFGTLADFDRLLAEAHRRGLRVIVDFVPNHTSDRHPWFEESRSSRTNPKRDWYVWADAAPDGGPPNNWRSFFLDVPAWTLDPATGQYYLHLFLAEQPDLNWWNPQVREEMERVLRFWLDRGVDGFRIDVAHLMLKDPALRDNPVPLPPPSEGGRMDQDRPEVHDIHRSWRRLLDSYPGERMAVGEVYILDPRRMVRYYGEAGDELHLAFNFSFLKQPWRAEAFRDGADLFESVLPDGAWPDYTLSNHDVSRARSRYGEVARARVAAMMLLTLRGTPFIYYGEEIGQADGEVPPERLLDMDGRDPERTPMQWAPGPGAGFTAPGVEPWLPIGREADSVNVAAQRDDPASMLSLYRRLLAYRRRSVALLDGSYHSLRAGVPEGVFAYLREVPGERLLVALNFTAAARRLDGAAAGLLEEGTLELTTDAGRATPAPIALRPLVLAPNEGVVVRL
jgi:alpha-glucosidase